ncbi:MAG: hypothetical protein IPK74_25685 [Deltaproteobacteria bacterium]|nr:hypothetical protein [Deltaproteobacteria bacterium]
MTEHERYLAAYRELHRPTDDERTRGWQGLAARARAGEIVALEDGDDDPVTGTGTATRRGAPVVLFAAAAAAALLWLGAQLPSWLASDGGHVSPQAASDARRTPSSSQARVVDDVKTVAPVPAEPPQRREAAMPSVTPSPTPTPAASDDATAIAPPRAGRRAPVIDAPREATIVDEVPALPAPTEPPTAVAAEATIDADEIAALRAAQALAASAPARALAAVAAHAGRYPSSSLAAEREITRMRALCNLGRADEVREAAATFERDHAGSPLLARVRGLCPDAD